MPGVIRFGPGEEKEAAIGALGSTVVLVLSMVPVGLLQKETQTCQRNFAS
jgi:hypothetical protein